MKQNQKKEGIKAIGFLKANLLNSQRYRAQRDIISVLLEDDICYTLAEVDKKINQFMKGKVT